MLPKDIPIFHQNNNFSLYKHIIKKLNKKVQIESICKFIVEKILL
jgi:hypothetical protein